METVLKAIADWIKGILTAGIMSNLSGLFDDVNTQVGNIAQQVGTKPSSFEPRVFAMIEALSRNVVLPIAGIILTFIACYELIEMITQHNNMAQFEPALIMRWIFKTAVSVWLISNTFDIVMAVFDLTQKVVSDSSSIIAGNDDIRTKLLNAGVPEQEIEFIHNADTENKKAELFSKVRSGQVRVLLGSTAKMGAGTNVQTLLVAVHHLDVGWRPSDMTQRNGRIIRQGNQNKQVYVYNYVTEGTFDSYLFQTLENKQRFISQIMTSKSPVRSCEDVDEQALSYAEIKALCAGNPLIKEKMDLDVQVAKLKVLKADHQSQKFRLQDKLLTKFPADIQETNAHIAGLKADAQLAAAHPQGKEEFCGMTIKGVTYDEKKTAGERLVLACSELPNAEEKVIGSYRGFELSLRFDTFRSEYQALLKGQRKYTVPLGTDPLGNIIRLDNSLNSFPERITSAENELTTLHQQQAAAQIEVEKPFPQEEELAEKSARLAELNAQLDVDEKSHEPEQDEEEQEDAPRRPSVLAALEEKSDKPEPVKPFRSYYDKDGDAR